MSDGDGCREMKDESAGRRAAPTAAALLVILAFAAFARFRALDFGIALPYARPDENRIAGQAEWLLTDAGAERRPPPSFAYPALFPRCVAWSIPVVAKVWPPPQGAPPHVTAYRTARVLSATAGVATVLLIFLLARAVGGSGVGLLAAALLAVAPLHVRDSHFGVTDVALGAASTALLLLLVGTTHWPRTRRFLVAGAALGVAASIKQPAIWLAAPLLLEASKPAPDDGPDGTARRRLALFSKSLLQAAIAAATVFLALNPGALKEPSRFLEENWFELVHKTEGAADFAQRGWLVHAQSTLREGLGWPVAAMTPAGALLLGWRGGRAARVVLTFAIAWYVGMGSGTRTFFRYMVPLLPVAALAAALALHAIVGRLHRRARRPATLLVLGAIMLPALGSVEAGNRLLAATDTRTLAADWLGARLRAGERVLWIDRYAFPFPPGHDERFDLRDGPALARELPPDVDPMQALRGGGWRYVVLADHWLVSRQALAPELRAAIAPALEEVARFSPLEEGRTRVDVAPVFDRGDLFFVPLAGADGFARPGPFLAVFRIRE
jgi:hypothetical protein